MHVFIRHNGTSLPSVEHEGQQWVVAPPEGAYEIVLYNNCPRRRLAVVAIDGVSILDGTDGSREGNGYVLEPWQRAVIPGWRRSDREGARFRFTANEGSYANQTGRGTRNTGIIAVAVFDEKPKPKVIIEEEPVVIRRRRRYWPWITPWPPPLVWEEEIIGERFSLIGEDTTTIYTANAVMDSSLGPVSTTTVQCCADMGNTKSALRGVAQQCSASINNLSHEMPAPDLQDGLASMDLGTGYGERVAMHTTTTTFQRASKTPALEIVIRYGVRERLQALGVPVDQAAATTAPTPDPFPGSGCPAPAGWSG